ncbi:hypothetical protein VTK26DRAFT_4475 [Humicola hyalothermophila]
MPYEARPGPDLGLLFELSPLPILLLSPARCITRASSCFLSKWDATAGNCVGHDLMRFVERQLRPPSPIHISPLATAIDDAVAARAERTCEPLNTRHSSSWIARVVPIFQADELLSILIEWREGPPSAVGHERDELTQMGLSTDEAFRILIHAVKDYAIFLLDTNGRIATWNKGAEMLKGYTRDEVIGKHFSIFYSKEDAENEKAENELELCLRKGHLEDEGWRYKKDGSRFWANVVITAIYKNGVHVGFGKVTRDLSERKSAESRLIAAYEESEKLKSEFLANMSHEIRTPMHGMLAACALLYDTELTARQREILGIMDESGQVLLQVINDILDYSKLTSGGFSIRSDVVGIASIVESVVRGAQATLQPTVDIATALARDLPRSVQGDPLRYRQILQNIVSNAAKFTDTGSIRVSAAVDSEDESSYLVRTEVTDTGIGIPESAAASLFTPFTQFDATATKRYKGTGLGLSIAKSLSELMGGRIGYRPNPVTHGSVFWFTARFKKVKSLEKLRHWKKTIADENGSTAQVPGGGVDELRQQLAKVSSTKNLLVVEDNLINQKVMLGMLRAIGFNNVGLASNGDQAVKMVRGTPTAYDVVLMDINMPIMGGHEAAKEIRAGGVHVPIIAMTAYALKGDRERCLEHGMNDYIAKPIDKKQLITTLGKWLLQMPDYRRAPDQGGAWTPTVERPEPVLAGMLDWVPSPAEGAASGTAQPPAHNNNNSNSNDNGNDNENGHNSTNELPIFTSLTDESQPDAGEQGFESSTTADESLSPASEDCDHVIISPGPAAVQYLPLLSTVGVPRSESKGLDPAITKALPSLAIRPANTAGDAGAGAMTQAGQKSGDYEPIVRPGSAENMVGSPAPVHAPGG